MAAILLVKTSSLGDVIHNLPVVTDIKRRFPGVEIHWVVEEAFADIPRLHPGVKRVIPVAIRRWRKRLFNWKTWDEISVFRHNLTNTAYDLVIDTQGLLKSALVTRYAIGHRTGFDSKTAREPIASWFYDQKFNIPTDQPAVERNRQLAGAALDYNPGKQLKYGLEVEPLITDWLPSSPYVVMLTATSRDDKLWSEDYWILICRLFEQAGIPCIFPWGSPTEQARAQRIAGYLTNAVIPPSMTIAELAGLLKGSLCVIGVDTGLTHLAVAVNVPTVAIFCASDPSKTGVYAGEEPPDWLVNLGNDGAPPQPGEVVMEIDRLVGTQILAHMEALKIAAAQAAAAENGNMPPDIPELDETPAAEPPPPPPKPEPKKRKFPQMY